MHFVCEEKKDKRDKTETDGVKTAQALQLPDTSCWFFAKKYYFQDNTVKPGITWEVYIVEYGVAAVIMVSDMVRYWDVRTDYTPWMRNM